VSPSGVTRALRPLEKLGYVSTERNDRDARQSLAKLTRGGKELLADVSEVLADFMHGLGIEEMDDESLDAAQKLLLNLA